MNKFVTLLAKEKLLIVYGEIMTLPFAKLYTKYIKKLGNSLSVLTH